MGLSVRSVLLTIKMINFMSTINRFEEMKTWQEARKLARLICALSQKDNTHRNQPRRAVISLKSNTAEGFERGSTIRLTSGFIKYLQKTKCPGTNYRRR